MYYCSYSKFQTLIWPITDTECQVWAKSAKISFSTVHIFKSSQIEKKYTIFFITIKASIWYQKFKHWSYINGYHYIFVDSFFHFRTFHCFEANTQFGCMPRFGTCDDFLTFLRFETIIHLEYLHDLVIKLVNMIM